MQTNYVYLHKVDAAANNNKFYEMTNNGNGTFTVKYGREGAAKPATETYPISKWDSKYNEKISSKKGYTDITDLKSVAKPTTSVSNSKKQLISNNPDVVKLITYLQEAANIVTKANYEVEAKQVTQAQIDKAQHQINILSKITNIDEFNKELVQLMIIIPRKMKRVADHCMPAVSSKKDLQKRIEEEQEMLDAMASQVTSDAPTDSTDKNVAKDDKTLLESLGLEMELCSDKKEIEKVKALVLTHKGRVRNIYKVVNKDTQKRYDAHLAKASNKKTENLFHGSRSANWFFILQQGLKIRPSGAVHTGSMFDDGVYFASDDDKSLGYTDSGRWVNGRTTNSVFMGVYEVHVGNQLVKHSHDSSCYTISKDVKRGGYDSVHAKKGPSLRKDEFIVYNSDQSTIKYLIEFSN